MGHVFIAGIALLVLLGCGSTTTIDATNESTANPQELSDKELEAMKCPEELAEDADFVDGYFQLSVCEWPVLMNADLFNNDKAEVVFDALRIDLGVIQSRLPKQIVNDLHSFKIWLEMDVPAIPGGTYHASAEWLRQNGFPVKWAKGVQLGNAQNYLDWRVQQPAMVLHELAHAYNDAFFNNANPALIAAYEAAKSTGIYESVAYIDPELGLLKAFALDNAREYFAELTEAYLWTNDYFPFTRTDLENHDVQGFEAVKAMWEQ